MTLIVASLDVMLAALILGVVAVHVVRHVRGLSARYEQEAGSEHRTQIDTGSRDPRTDELAERTRRAA